MSLQLHMNAVKIKERQLEKLNLSDWIMEEKFKGIRVWYYKEFSQVRLITRGGEDVTANFPHITEIDHTPYYENITLDCELYDPNQQDEVVSGWAMSGVGLDPEKTRNCILKIFDIAHLYGQELLAFNQLERKGVLTKLKLYGPLEIVEYFPADNHRSYYDYIVGKGGEGIMLKNKYSTYQPGRRTVTCWFKRKKRDPYDVVITGFTEGKGKFAGLIGAIEVSQFIGGSLVHICNVSGMDDLTRRDMTMNKELYLGKVISVWAMEQDANSCALIEPSFSHIRVDKRPEECTPELF